MLPVHPTLTQTRMGRALSPLIKAETSTTPELPFNPNLCPQSFLKTAVKQQTDRGMPSFK